MSPICRANDILLRVLSISPTNEGGFILGGSIHYSDDGHTAFAGGWLCKLDQSGLITWQRGYYDFIPGYIIQTIDGGYLETSGGGGPGGIIKLDSSGANQWIRFVPSTSAFQTDDEGYVMFFGDYFYNPHENEKFGVLCVDRDGMIGPSCSLIMNGSYSEMNPLIREASGTAIGPYEDSIWVHSDEYIPFPRSCHQVETICSYQLRE